MQEEQIFMYWLYFVLITRFFGIYSAYFLPHLIDRVFEPSKKTLAAVFYRLFGTWTLVNTVSLIALIVDTYSKTVYALNIVVFLIALQFFILELKVFKTMSFIGAALTFIAAAGTSSYMAIRWFMGLAHFTH